MLVHLDIPREKELNYLQTVKTRRMERLIWVCTVCQLPFWWCGVCVDGEGGGGGGESGGRVSRLKWVDKSG